jgi:hypothetical protein
MEIVQDNFDFAMTFRPQRKPGYDGCDRDDRGGG